MDSNNETWDRASVLDPSWERQQIRAFTEWCNSHLKKVNMKVEAFDKDFMGGLLLIKLLEVISNETLPRPETKTMRFHKIANLNIALNFIETKGVRLASIGAEEIVDGNIKMTLGMIWTIILRFAIQNIHIEERSAKEGLLLWTQRKTAGYRGVDIQNFHTSFKDGMAFGALIHRHRPDLIDIQKYDRMHPRNNLNDAFAVAEKHLDIPRMLDTEDLIQPGMADELSVMAYVSTFYHRFTSDQKAVKAAETICQALKVNQESENLMEKYEGLSTRLLEWIKSTVKWLDSRPAENSLNNAYKILNAYHNYGLTEKPSYYGEKIELENIYNCLQTRLKLSGRPCFIPKEGQLISDIEREWAKLDIAEEGFEEWIFKLIETLRFFSQLVNKFYKRCASYENWLDEKRSELPSINPNSVKLGDIKPMLNMAFTVRDAISSDDSENDPFSDISDIASFFRKQNYYDVVSINNREKELIDKHADLSRTCLSIIGRIEKYRAVLEKADTIQLEYAVRVTAFKKWLDSVNDDFENINIINCESDANQLIVSNKEFEETLPSAETRLEQIRLLVTEIGRCCEGTDLPKLNETVYSVVSIHSVMAAWTKMNKMRVVRLKELEDEAKNQRYIHVVKENFRNSSIEANNWIRKMAKDIKEIQSINSETLEPELEYLVKCEVKVAEFEPTLAVLEAKYQKVVDAKVFDTRNLGYSVQKLKIDYEKLRSYISSVYIEVEQQKLARMESTGISQENISNYQTSFAHFDKDNDHKLDSEEFRNCLISLGYDSATVENDRTFYELMKRLDKNNTGSITFTDYLEFMNEINESHETVDNITSCFRVLANGKPYITAKVLRDNLEHEFAEYCIRNMQPYSQPTEEQNPLDYVSFSFSLFGGSSDM